MRKNILIFLILLNVANLYAQSKSDDTLIKCVVNRIAFRDSLIRDIKKKDVLIDTLSAQVGDYNMLTTQLTNELSKLKNTKTSLKCEIDRIRLLLSPDTIVFFEPLISVDSIPLCLKQHIGVIKGITELRIKIESVEKKVEDIATRLSILNNTDSQSIIRDEIEKDVYELDKMITEIEAMDMSSLSENQKAFFRPILTERYNKFLIYFE
ncbi:hypothetical protein [Parabacteroides timonensis]|uniref:hypothetical protein n=1 Tax=Parabacteroides timonensis TaxID=1871013 RepID=UPI00094E2543|nr:hypothetical protein [Parabacteroides timonensis]